MLGVAGGLGRGHGHKRGAPGTAPAGGGQRGAAGPAAPGSHGAEPAEHGLARWCWRGGCGAQRGAPRSPHAAPPAPLLPPRHGDPQPGRAAGTGIKSVNTESVNTTSTHTPLGGETGHGAVHPTVCLQPQPPCAGHPPPAAPHGPGPAGRRWKRWGRTLLLAITAAVPCAVPAPPALPSLQALGPLLVSPAAAPGPRGGRQRLPAGTHPAPAWLPGRAVRHPCCSPVPRGLVCGEPVSRKRPNPHPWQPGARGPPTALPSVPWGGRSARRARTGSSGAYVHGRARAMPAAQPFVWVPSGTRQLLRGSCKSET